MKNLSLVMTAVIAAGGAVVAAMVIIYARTDEKALDQGHFPRQAGPAATSDQGHDGQSGPAAVDPRARMQPGRSVGPDTRLHPLLGPIPPAPQASGSQSSIPPGLDPSGIERKRDENVKKVVEIERERAAREIAMFEDVMGPLDPQVARGFLDVYYRHYEDAWRDFSERVTRGERPDRAQVYRTARERAYATLAGILDPVQLDKFRTWWEEQSRTGD